MGTIHYHHDADGITSAYFASFGYPDYTFRPADKFGDTKNWTKGDVMVDMRPINPKIEGTVIDHHFPHPEDRKYTLIPEADSTYANAIIPASLITWLEFKDKIPKKEWWKLAVGLAGDGQIELMPTEIYDECPSLLREVKSSSYTSYGKTRVSMYPLYKLLSSPINALLRKGEYEGAMNLLKYAETPLDIYSSEDARIAKIEVKNEYNQAIKDCEVYYFGNLALVMFHSRFRMSGYIGTAIASILGDKTILAINKREGSVSLRGKLATYYRDKLKSIEYLHIDGHAEYMGGKLDKNYTELIKDMNAIL